MATLTHSASVTVAAEPADVYALFSDVSRMAEASPTCNECVYEDGTTPGAVGSVFLGRNESHGNTWETRNEVIVADGTSFGWSTGPGLATWTYSVAPGEEAGTSVLTEAWEFNESGQAGMRKIFGERAEQIIANAPASTEAAVAATLASMKQSLESTSA